MKNRHELWMAAIWALLAVVLATAATYAWFTFTPNTEVEPLDGQMTEGKVKHITEIKENKLPDAMNLQISNDNKNFSTETSIKFSAELGNLEPISTPDLNKFFTAVAHDKNGISNRFVNSDDKVDTATMHGTVYLRSLAATGKVYIDMNNLEIKGDNQALAACRLGLKFSLDGKGYSYIFRLDDSSDKDNVDYTQTVNKSGTVVSEVNGGIASFVADPSVSLNTRSDPDNPLISIPANKTAVVEYFIYAEGCDDNCSNAVMQKDISVSLAFAAKPQ